MQRYDPLARVDGERRPGREAEVRVDDVEALVAEAPPQVDRRTQQAARAGRERVDLHVEAADASQRLHLVAHEAAQGRDGWGTGTCS